MSAYTFDATKVAPSTDRTAVPPDTYSVILNSSEIKVGKTPADRLMSLGMKVLEGPLSGSIISQSLNILHSNPVAQQIAQERFSALCHAIGVLQITDTAQLHGRPFKVKTSIRLGEKADGTPDGKQYTEIDAYLKADGSSVTAAGTNAAPGAPGGAAPAWAQPPAATPPPAAAPAPAPVAPAPAPAPAPVATPAPAPEKTYYVAEGGANVTGNTPIPLSQVLSTYGSRLASVQVLEHGTQTWVAGATLTAAAPAATPPPAAAGLPPWMTPPATA